MRHKKLFVSIAFIAVFSCLLFAADIDTLNRKLNIYQRQMGHDYQVKTLYAYQLGVITAAHAAHGVSNQWNGIWVVPLADSDEIHAIFMIPHNANLKYPMYLRWVLVPNNNSSGATLTTTVDKVDMTRTMEGSDVTADGATSLDTVIPAITDAETTAETPLASDWGKISGSNTLYDALFVKLVASSASGADRLRVAALQIGYKRFRSGFVWQ